MIKHKLGISLLLTTGLTLGALLFVSSPVSAATLTVNSADDGAPANDGVCTLREAIIAANNDTASGAAAGECIAGSGTDTINFNITTGGTTFTNQDETGYTIQPSSGLPPITETVIIDGYSQPGAEANTAPAPNPLNGRLLVELDGANQPVSFIDFQPGSNGSELKGLVLNRTQTNAIRIRGSSNVSVQGNYVGTDPTGLIARPNGSDEINTSTAIDIGDFTPLVTDTQTVGTLIGGTNPQDRNIVSGNYGGAFGVIGVDSEFYGNYFGLGADGLTTLGNSNGTGVTTGVLTIDYADGVQIGNGQSSGMNIISGNARGIQPDYSTDITIIGNRIGTDHSGSLPRPNLRNGISIALETSNVRIGGPNNGDGNLIAFNIDDGITTSYSGGDQVSNVAIMNNTVQNNTGTGININGSTDVSTHNNTVQNNTGTGININNSTYASVHGNTVRNNGDAGVRVVGSSAVANNNVVTSNVIDGNSSGGVSLVGLASNNIVGGSDPGDANEIRNNGAAGIAVISLDTPGPVLVPSNNSLIGNSITATGAGLISGLANPGLGVDIFETELDGTFTPISATEEGVTLNDVSDADTGPNAYINFPVLNSATQDGTDLTLNLDLEAAGTTDPDGLYRVELFANDEADPSGYGEGQTYLGFANVANGDNQDVTITLTEGTDLTGKVLSATTTAMNNTTDSTYGSTSEFSLAADINVIAPATADTDSLANTGWNIMVLTLLAGGMMGASLYIVVTGRLRYYLGRY